MNPVEVFQALSHPVRRHLLQQFPPFGEVSRDLLADAVRDESTSNVSQHIRVLTKARLISARKSGRDRYYSLRRESLLDLQHALSDLARTPRERDRYRGRRPRM